MRVASIGECMVELTLPREDGNGSRVGFAGDTFNAAVYLKRSAPEITVSYVTALGTDPLSARMIAFFESEDLDTSLIERRADRVPGLYAISLDAKGERSFTYWRDSSAARTLFLPPAEVNPSNLNGFDLIYLSGITLAVLAPEARAALADFLRGYRQRGGRLAFDSNYRPRLWPDADTARREIVGLLGDHRHRPPLARRRDGALRRAGRGRRPGSARGRRRPPRRAEARTRRAAAPRRSHRAAPISRPQAGWSTPPPPETASTAPISLP